MKKKLTLVELSTIIFVIVILILISLPIVLNKIEIVRKNKSIDIAYKYIEEIEDSLNLIKLKDKLIIKDGEYDNLEKFEEENKIKIKGERPNNGTLKLQKGIIVSSKFVINEYTIICNKKECKIVDKIEKITSNINNIDKPKIVKKEYKEKESSKKETITKKDKSNNSVLKDSNNENTKSKYTITLENAEFSDGTTSKVVEYGKEVEIKAIIPGSYIDSDYSGITTCNSLNDSGKTKYKIKHEYILENWNINNTNNSVIKYKVLENKTIKANIKEVKIEIDKSKCESVNALYSAAYYDCPNGGTLKESKCVKSGSYTATIHRSKGTCRGCLGGDYEGCRWMDYECDKQDYTCPNGGSQKNGICYYSSSYQATYHEAYYYCQDNWTLVDSRCYKMTSIN